MNRWIYLSVLFFSCAFILIGGLFFASTLPQLLATMAIGAVGIGGNYYLDCYFAERGQRPETLESEPEVPHRPLAVPEPAEPLASPQRPQADIFFGFPVDSVNEPLILPQEIREQHLYLIGKSDAGKTALVKNLILRDIENGRGVAFIDPHGDAASDLLANIPTGRMQDVISFDPTWPLTPVCNVFRLPYPAPGLSEDIIAALQMFFGDAWEPWLEPLLRFSVLTLLTHPAPHALKDLHTLLRHPGWREQIISNHPDESVRKFWREEFRTFEGAADSILDKLATLLLPGSPLVRHFSQRENDLDFSRIINEQKILICNLSQGTLGDAPAYLLGGLLATGIQQAALARADMPARERKDFFLYADEFQHYTVASFSSVLAEARTYRLFLILANRHLGQLPSALEHAVCGNVATLVSLPMPRLLSSSLPDLHTSMRAATEISDFSL
ncbi:MAG TPA: hypothetical protein VGX03_08965 [Candidatus Binatia bacterium]|nr:hypothetical protein [Candidatus Binatia bacterium]